MERPPKKAENKLQFLSDKYSLAGATYTEQPATTTERERGTETAERDTTETGERLG